MDYANLSQVVKEDLRKSPSFSYEPVDVFNKLYVKKPHQ